MKKLMMIVTAMVFAVGVQAAQVSWAAVTGNSVLGGTPSGSGSVYIFALGGSVDAFGTGGFDILTLSLTSTGNTVYSQATSSGYAFDDGYWVSGEVASVFSNTSGDTASSSPINQWWAVVLVDAASTGWYGVDVFQVSGQTVLTSAFSRELEDFNVTQYTTVPEPTSMALLALGVAAVGLRRKFRK